MLTFDPAAQAFAAESLELRYLDEMEDVSGWKALASDGVSASVHGAKGVQGNGLVLEFDLASTAGYAAATKVLPTQLPEDYEISFWMRAEAGRNHFEVKFVDASGDNVWWFRRANYRFSGEWQQVRIKRRQIDFAWGPTADRTLRGFQSIEFVVSAGQDGGKGNLWFDRLALKPVVRPQVAAKPTARASSEEKQNTASMAIDGNGSTMWRSQRTQSGEQAREQTFEVDLQAPREFGGLEIDWARGLHAPRYAIEFSDDGQQWRTVRKVEASNGGRDSHMLPESEARYIRLRMPDPGREVGITELHVRDLEFGASPNAFIRALAKDARRGCYPRPFNDEQSYWTILGVDGDSEESMLSEDGALEARKGSFSVEPFIRTRKGVLTWADVSIRQSLADGYLPIPSVEWKHRDIELTTTAYASGAAGSAHTQAIYKLRNPGKAVQSVTLALVVRPFQVNSPAQFLNTEGGVSPIQDLSFENDLVRVDGVPAVRARTTPQAFRAVALAADTPCDWLVTSAGSRSVRDESGFASGALLYDIELQPGQTREIALDLPLHPQSEEPPGPPVSMAKVADEWREKLNRVELVLPDHELVDTLRTSLAHVLINRDGPAIQPGSRAYERSWIRDGAMTSDLLLRLGHEKAAREFLQWYAPYQFENGKVPCCVDRRGADPVPENDSQGEFLFLIDEIHRYTHDDQLLQKMWPAVRKAVQYMDKLRLSERTPQNQQGERRALYGLMPASISHEGYSAKPMHSYWDNFWALAGYESAIRIARALDQKDAMRSFIESRDEFRSDLYRSLQIAMKTHGIDYLPGAAELGDFDATSTSIALSPVGEQQMLPPDALNATFERYWKEFSTRRTDTSWDAYTPYEWRNLGTFIRLRWRERGMELIDFFMNDRRPAAWNQWAEVVGREPRKSRFIGDMPHGWVASDYGRSLLDMLAFERQADETLVLMAGVPEEWTTRSGFSIKNLRTPYGLLTYSLKVDDKQRVLNVEKIEMPTGGLAIAWPEGKQPQHQSIQRGSGRWIGTEMRVTELPLTIVFPQ